MNSTAPYFEETLEATISGLRDSLRWHMPPGQYRDYYMWAISSANPHQLTFLQGIGVVQLVKLTLNMLDGLVSEADWPRMIWHSIPINVYQTFEIVSDNLGMGMANKTSNPRQEAQRQLLRTFNKAMMRRLDGEEQHASEMLRSMISYSGSISAFDQTLSRNKQMLSVRAYLQQQRGAHLDELKYTLWPALVMNIESANALAKMSSDYAMGDIVRDGLIHRYWAVNRLLDGRKLPLDELTSIGAYSILAVGSLGYYVLAFGEILSSSPHFQRLVEDGSIYSMLYHAAVLTRLLNDLGTGLAMLPEMEIRAWMDMMRRYYEQCGADTIQDLLLKAPDPYNLLVRIRKDMEHGEFNMALNHLDNSQPVLEALEVFGDNLAYFSRLYAEKHVEFEDILGHVGGTLGDKAPSALVLRFVKFHEKMYTNRYTANAGEFAI